MFLYYVTSLVFSSAVDYKYSGSAVEFSKATERKRREFLNSFPSGQQCLMKTLLYLFTCLFNDAKPIPEATQRRMISGLRDFMFHGGYDEDWFLLA